MSQLQMEAPKMPAYFESGFMVREPAWHGLGEVLDDYPGREEGMRLAGHDFLVVEQPIYLPGQPVGENAEAAMSTGFIPVDDEPRFANQVDGWKALVKQAPDELRHEDPAHGKVMHVAKDSYGVVQNDVGWDIVDAIVGEGAKYETAGTLKGGSTCWVLAWLDEPVEIPGDNSVTLPFVNVSWTHDGTGALVARSTSVRVVCWNTQSASEAQGKKLGTDYKFRHTKNVMEHIEDAKMALQGVRDQHVEYAELARELAEIPVTAEQRELFVSQFIPMPDEALISNRVKGNVEQARAGVRALFDGPTIPEAHEFTAYGLQLAGVEFLDHVRPARSPDTKFGRSLLRDEPAKSKLTGLIREVVKA